MKLPTVSGKKLIKILVKKGYWIKDQKGSHIHLRHPTKMPITVKTQSNLKRNLESYSESH